MEVIKKVGLASLFWLFQFIQPVYSQHQNCRVVNANIDTLTSVSTFFANHVAKYATKEDKYISDQLSDFSSKKDIIPMLNEERVFRLENGTSLVCFQFFIDECRLCTVFICYNGEQNKSIVLEANDHLFEPDSSSNRDDLLLKSRLEVIGFKLYESDFKNLLEYLYDVELSFLYTEDYVYTWLEKKENEIHEFINALGERREYRGKKVLSEYSIKRNEIISFLKEKNFEKEQVYWAEMEELGKLMMVSFSGGILQSIRFW